MGQMPCIELLSSISEFEDIVTYFLPTQLSALWVFYIIQRINLELYVGRPETFKIESFAITVTSESL